jgi:hypothetical protein
MSTSASDGKKSGVGSLFKRAIEERRDIAPPSAPVPEKMELRSCAKCGAPRKQEELICTFCGEKL